jgi:small subunit ribosomal protein S18
MRRQPIKRLRPVAKNCQFCNTKTNPDYKDAETLRRYITERGKLLAASRTGVCSKHQRNITTEIKRARMVALLPFVVRA